MPDAAQPVPEPLPEPPDHEPKRLLSRQLSPPTYTHTLWRLRQQSVSRRWE